MDAASQSSASTSPTEELQSKEQPQQQQEQEPQQSQQDHVKECLYKTKTIQFLGRTTPIILQNDNGPCPLLAICNILLLRNNFTINADNSEVSQERLLSLVAERLIDSNSNISNKDAGYVENQQQNIADAIDLLPRLATGIDVNIKFRRIDDFEFTRECAIFDLLDIPLYHGWIVDPQDFETAKAIGNKSYNALMGELVALETQNFEGSHSNISGEDSVDFAAATTAALGVPSPCLSRNRSFDDSPPAAIGHRRHRKGDLEEEAELQRALKLSEDETSTLGANPVVTTTNRGSLLQTSGGNQSSSRGDVQVNHEDAADGLANTVDGFDKSVNLMLCNHTVLSKDDGKPMCPKVDAKEEVSSTLLNPDADMSTHFDQLSFTESVELLTKDDPLEKSSKQDMLNDETKPETPQVEDAGVKPTISDDSIQMLVKTVAPSIPGDCPASSRNRNLVNTCQEDEEVGNQLNTVIHEAAEELCGDDKGEVSSSSMKSAALESNEKLKHDGSDGLATNVDGNEPIYEGEECILDSGTMVCEDSEPVYEGEAILAENAGKSTLDSSKSEGSERLTAEEGELIRNFLKNSASQLTFYGLFCLQEGLKERELCVFFRNNHFSTMFKYEGELYLLATDQGYLNQPELVWEKLNEVNGDTLFMTGNFKEFKVENNNNGTWDEHGAMTSTADYLASINGASQAKSDINSDLQLAIALQQQEFEQQPTRNNTPPSAAVGASRLITGPQAPRNGMRNTSSTVKPEGKSKDKCTVM